MLSNFPKVTQRELAERELPSEETVLAACVQTEQEKRRAPWPDRGVQSGGRRRLLQTRPQGPAPVALLSMVLPPAEAESFPPVLRHGGPRPVSATGRWSCVTGQWRATREPSGESWRLSD